MSMNKVFLSGRLTADPELRDAKGTQVCSFTLACDTRHKDGNNEKITNFYRCSAWRGLGETCAKYLKKGDPLEVTGDLALRAYTDTKGVQRYSLDVTVNDVGFISTREKGDGKNAPSHPPASPISEEDELPF